MINNNELNKEGGTKIIKKSYGKMPCLDPNHNVPTHICLPMGHVLEHVCPSCGRETTVEGPIIIW